MNATESGAILVSHCRPRTLTSAFAQGKCFCLRHHSAAQRSLIERTAGLSEPDSWPLVLGCGSELGVRLVVRIANPGIYGKLLVPQ